MEEHLFPYSEERKTKRQLLKIWYVMALALVETQLSNLRPTDPPTLITKMTEQCELGFFATKFDQATNKTVLHINPFRQFGFLCAKNSTQE